MKPRNDFGWDFFFGVYIYIFRMRYTEGTHMEL